MTKKFLQTLFCFSSKISHSFAAVEIESIFWFSFRQEKKNYLEASLVCGDLSVVFVVCRKENWVNLVRFHTWARLNSSTSVKEFCYRLRKFKIVFTTIESLRLFHMLMTKQQTMLRVSGMCSNIKLRFSHFHSSDSLKFLLIVARPFFSASSSSSRAIFYDVNFHHFRFFIAKT